MGGGATGVGRSPAADLATRLLRGVRRGPRLWEQRGRIAFLGDSLTAGTPGVSYLPLLEQRVGRHRFLNFGRAGDTVTDLSARMRRAGLDPVDFVFLWVGADDASAGAWTSRTGDAFEQFSWGETLDQIGASYGRLVDWLLERAWRIVCVPPISPDGLDLLWEQRVADVAEMVRDTVASETRADLLDLAPWFDEARFGRPDARFTIDGVHLSQTGAEVVADAFAAQISAEAAGTDRPASRRRSRH
jgi:lysophospholipase L1-like esterase